MPETPKDETLRAAAKALSRFRGGHLPLARLWIAEAEHRVAHIRTLGRSDPARVVAWAALGLALKGARTALDLSLGNAARIGCVSEGNLYQCETAYVGADRSTRYSLPAAERLIEAYRRVLAEARP